MVTGLAGQTLSTSLLALFLLLARIGVALGSAFTGAFCQGVGGLTGSPRGLSMASAAAAIL